MKECEKYAALLDAFSEGDLFMEDMVQVQNHLMNCPDCQAYLEDLLAMRAAFPTVEDTEVPEGFADRVMAAVAEHPRAAAPAPAPKAKKQPWRKLLIPLAACCALVILLGRTAISGGSSKEAAAKFSAQAETTEECAVAEETVEMVSSTEAAPEEPAAAYDGKMEPAEAEALLGDVYTYTTGTESQITEHKGKEYVEVTVTEPSAAESGEGIAEDAAASTPTRDGTEFVLTAAEAGDTLKDFTPVAETETELYYELTARQYTGLLMALPREVRQSAPANAAETMRVVVLK